MNRNVGIAVGATLRRCVVDQPLSTISPLPQFNLTFFRTLRPLGPAAPHRNFSSHTSSLRRPFSLFTPHRPTPPCHLTASPSSHTSPPRYVLESVTAAAAAAWKRQSHSHARKGRRRGVPATKRNKSSVTGGRSTKVQKPSAPQAELSPQPKASPRPIPPVNNASEQSHESSKPLLDRLPQHLPHLHRPSKAELLAAASGFWSRMKVRFKWLTIRSTRPFNADEIYAMFSWILAAHILWIVVGTTTFFSIAIFMINSVFAQETLAKWIGNYLTQSSGIKVVFESAVVPKWKDGVISFRKVFVSRRPGQGRARVSKGSQTSAAAAAAAIAHKEKGAVDGEEEEEDTNYTQFDISIDAVNVTLSFSKWMNGKGLLKDVEIKGIRGVVDRTSVYALEEYVDPRTYKHEHQPGDFELDSFKMEDLLVTVYQPDDFRPFSVSIYSCDLPQLRKQWLFYDFLSANMMSGSYDNSLFTIHPRQTHNYTGMQLNKGLDTEDGQTWKKQSRIRIDGLSIDHLNRGYDGPFSWIYEGNVDIVSDIMIPNENDASIAKVMSDMYDRVEATVKKTNTSLRVVRNDHNHTHISDHAHGFDGEHQEEAEQGENDEDNRFIIMDIRVHLNDVRAAVPIFTNDLSYVNNALVRPIVAYINSKKTFIPVNCRVVKRAGEFDGSWTLYDSGLMDDVSREMYDAFAKDVLNDNTARKRRIKKVGIWTLQLAAQALFLGLAGNIA
ncbi:hypothetical protein BU24DRAFT_369819 [Aaosphaeria arxii CBS 175.79]|uniref:Mitochondrial distribution and morphology protein family 31/32 n=1 Tax=Aaosphaeria arxii CBS 175.79 TaxID=1450172 RepID=A0A6A5XT56_9PLEO|nr:uncharacterized protein BU24DRAFT_369819 [Aaosphaeria arxii CBS 175.79]KAF2015901.1 hypothetical protein BU24DRAFT_369819 [Aaosphaeria arxii CBS 175.79]